jgi:hypothetical protein
MNRARFFALFLILLGIAAFGNSVWLMFDWSTAYEAGLDYSSVMLESARTGSTLTPLQESPPFGGGLLGILAPSLFAAVGAGWFCFGLYQLNKAP